MLPGMGNTGSTQGTRVVFRTARVGLRPTRGQARRLYGLLRAGGDVWAALIELNRERARGGAAPVVNYQALCRELAGADLGELDMVAARSVLRRYTDAWFEANRRKRRGEKACYPRRKRALMPLRWYHATFGIDAAARRVRIRTARGCPPLVVRLTHLPPYPVEQVRAVTLVAEAGRLWLDVTAAVPVAAHDLDPDTVAGVDVGIIHPYAVAAGDQALVVSGRAVRAEERLHLDDTRQRAKRMGRKAPKKGQRGSRRWRKLRAKQRKQEARHRRRVRQAHHEAAKQVIDWAVAHRAGTLIIGDPKGITGNDVGAVGNWRLRAWRRTHLTQTLQDKAEAAGIHVELVDERGTSSTCPDCGARTPKPAGRRFACPACGQQGHRDIVGARNIAAKRGGTTRPPRRVQHRRAGTPARRDHRRHLYDRRRSCPDPGRPAPPGGRESLAPTARITEPLVNRQETSVTGH
jgi:IS605 OrfB family transposase